MPTSFQPPHHLRSGAEGAPPTSATGRLRQDEPEQAVGGVGGALQGQDQLHHPHTHPAGGAAAEQGQRGEGEEQDCQLRFLEQKTEEQ